MMEWYFTRDIFHFALRESCRILSSAWSSGCTSPFTVSGRPYAGNKEKNWRMTFVREFSQHGSIWEPCQQCFLLPTGASFESPGIPCNPWGPQWLFILIWDHISVGSCHTCITCITCVRFKCGSTSWANQLSQLSIRYIWVLTSMRLHIHISLASYPSFCCFESFLKMVSFDQSDLITRQRWTMAWFKGQSEGNRHT